MYLIPWGLLVIAIVLIDMATKYLVSTSMALHQSIPLINGVFHITYVLNDGASFGIFRGGRWFFVAITLILIGFIAGYVIYKKERNKLYLLSAVRLFIIPIICMAVLFFLPQEFAEMKMALLIVAACPTGSNVAVYAQLYDSDYSYAVETVIISTLLSIISIPLIVQLAELIRFI